MAQLPSFGPGAGRVTCVFFIFYFLLVVVHGKGTFSSTSSAHWSQFWLTHWLCGEVWARVSPACAPLPTINQSAATQARCWELVPHIQLWFWRMLICGPNRPSWTGYKPPFPSFPQAPLPTHLASINRALAARTKSLAVRSQAGAPGAVRC